MADTEEWRVIPGYTRYSASSMGRIKNTKTLRIMKQTPRKKYLVVGLVPDGVRNVHTCFLVHRLVAQAFLPNPEGKPAVDHFNREEMDNRVSNLSWVSHIENCQNNGISVRNSSGYKGVYWNKGAQQYMAYIRMDGKLKYLGLFDDPEEASAHRDEVGKALFPDHYKTTEESLLEWIETL